jgi:hypothetical protein
LEKLSAVAGQVPCKNIDSAITNAKKYGAEGILLTSWGDCGNHQPWATLIPCLFFMEQLMHGKANQVSEVDLVYGMNNFSLTTRAVLHLKPFWN